MRSIILLLTLAAATVPLSATAIQAGNWYQFVSLLDNSVTNGAGDSQNPQRFLDPGASPWTFTLLSAGSLDVTDAQIIGDSYNILNNGAQLAFTGQSGVFDPANNCGLDPAACFTAVGFSHTTVQLGAGSYSITLRAVDNPNFSSSGFLRVNGTLGTNTGGGSNGGGNTGGGNSAVPEPGSLLLAAGALGVLILRKK